MAKEVKFKISLKVDGKGQLAEATVLSEDLTDALSATREAAESLKSSNLSNLMMGLEASLGIVDRIDGRVKDMSADWRSWEQSMAAANTMAGKDAEGLEKLRESVSGLASDIPIAKEALAEGLYQTISNGVPESNWLTFLERSAKASVGGLADLGQTVTVTSTLIKNYGLEWDKAGEIQDKIQLTAKNGVTSFEQLAGALPRVSGNAATLGVSIDELMATFATLTGVSGNTAEVSTQLAAIFTALVKPSSEAAKMAEEMGVRFDAAAIKAAGGMKQFLTTLSADIKAYASSHGMLEEEIYGKLFGSAEALRALTPLTGELADRFAANVATMQSSAGTIDAAFAEMSQTGSATAQLLENRWRSMTEGLAHLASRFEPVLSGISSLGRGAMEMNALWKSIMALREAHIKLSVAQNVSNNRLMRGIAAYALFGTNMRRVSAAMDVMGNSCRSAATRALALKLAFRGLLAATGIGLGLAALSIVLGKLINNFDAASDAAEGTADSLEQLDSKASELKQTYDSALSSTFSGLMTKYDGLREAWKSLKTEHEKMAWIKDNQGAFEELRLQINSVSDAENLLVSNTDSVVEAFKRRAEAAAYAAKLAKLYEQRIELEGKIRDDAQQRGHNAKAGDVIPVNGGYRNTRYGKLGYSKDTGKEEWLFTEEGAARYNGTDVSSNKEVYEIDKKIDATSSRLSELKKADIVIKPTSTIVDNKTDTPKVTGRGGGGNTGNTGTDKPEPLKGSIDYYQKELDELRKKIYAAADEATAKTLQTTYEYKEAQLQRLKIRVGLEEPKKEEAKTYMEQLQERLNEAKKTFDNATTIEARVQADAQVQAIQAEINEATYGRLRIPAEVEPSYIQSGSTADKRASYDNAQAKAGRIQQDYEIGIIGKDEALRQLVELNAVLFQMGLEPVHIEVETEDIDKAKAKFDATTDAIGAMGSSFSGLGDALELPELNIAGTIAQAIATMAQGYATATAQAAAGLGPIAWVGFAATGLAQLTAMIQSVKKVTAFAEGGIVSGPTLGLIGEYAGASNNPEVIAPLDKLRSMMPEPGGMGGNVRFEIEGRKLVGVIGNETQVSAKSGRRNHF